MTTPQDSTRNKLVGWISRHKIWSAVIALVFLFVVIGSFGSAGSKSSTKSSDGTKSTETSKQAATTSTVSTLEQKRADLRNSLKSVDYGIGETDVRSIEFDRTSTTVNVATPEGGAEGASTKDIDYAAGQVFSAVYGKAGYSTPEVVVVFSGGLVSTATGEKLDDVNTGIYTLKRGQANRIDWSDGDTIKYVIDWSLYRDFAHPALKQE